MAKIKKVGRWWYGDGTRGGKRFRPKLSLYREKAQKMFDELMEIHAAEKNGLTPKNVPWFFFREKYLAYRKAKTNPSTYNNDVRALDMVEKHGRPLLRTTDMTPEYLDDFWIKSKTKGFSDRTISGWVRRMKTTMHKAEDWGLAPMQLWRKVKCLPDGKRTGYLSFPEFKKVLAACKGAYHRATMLMGWAGLRRGEVLHLEWPDIDFKNHVIKIQAKVGWVPKGSKEGAPKNRVVDMTGDLEAYLQGLPHQVGLVLGQAINEDNFSKYYRDLGKELGIALFPHKFRHTCASFLISNGASPEVVGELFGQSDLRSTKVYTHMMPHARRNAVDQMQAGARSMMVQNGQE